MLVSGLGLSADTVELFVIPYILPSAEFELCMNASQKAWLSEYTAPLEELAGNCLYLKITKCSEPVKCL